jgi:hypothetical protein
MDLVLNNDEAEVGDNEQAPSVLCRPTFLGWPDRLSIPGFPVPAVLSARSCPQLCCSRCPVLVLMFLPSCPVCPLTAVLFRMPCPGCPRIHPGPLSASNCPPFGFYPFHPFPTPQPRLHYLHRRHQQSRSSSSGPALHRFKFPFASLQYREEVSVDVIGRRDRATILLCQH